MSLWQGIGYNIVILIAGLTNINPSVMEAARIDGTNAWNRFWRVTFPMLSPSLFFCSVMTVIGQILVFRVARSTLLRHMAWQEISSEHVDLIIAQIKANLTAMLHSKD